MSLINQMLKDLESRATQAVNPDITLSGLLSRESTSTIAEINKYTIPILLCVFVSLFLALFFYKHPLKKEHNAISPFIYAERIQPVGEVPTQMSLDNISSSASLLTGITLQTQNNTTSLRFLLNQDVLYSVSFDTSHNKLILVLDHTNVVSDLPAINYIKSGIKEMEVAQDRSGNLKVTLTLNSDTDVQRLNLNNTVNQTSELQLDLATPKETRYFSPEKNTSTVPQKEFIKRPIEEFNIEQQYKSALELSTIGEKTKATHILLGLLEKYPQLNRVRESLVTMFLANKDLNKAKQILNVGLDQDPNSIPFIELKAQILIREGKLNRALDLLQRAAPPVEQNPDYHALIAGLYQRQGESLLASKLYEQLLMIHPNRGVWWMGLAISLESLGDSSEAKEAYLNASNSNDINPELKAFVQSRMSSI